MIPKRNLSEDKVSLTIDLKKLFGKPINDSVTRREIAEDLIDIINKRTAGGGGVNGSGKEVDLISPYSESYAASDEFKAFGKKKNKVNMKLTGSMLASVDMISEDKNTIEIGIDNEEAPKAYNHIVGDTVPKRPFLGLTSDDLNKVRDKYADSETESMSVADIFEGKDLARLVNIIGGRRRLFGFEE